MRRDAQLETMIAVKFPAVVDALDERGRRLWAAAESDAIGCGGDALVSDAIDLSRDTIRINATADDFLQRAQPVISVDTKKKELVGDFKTNSREWQPQITPEKSLAHDFPQDAQGTTIPYGVHDMGLNEAWVNVGRDHDTAGFAVASIRRWLSAMGQSRYPDAQALYITSDAGGGNGYRARAWKHELQTFSDDTGLQIRVRHFPPGTSKWNKIEHRLFCHIASNWRGKPLRLLETFVVLIGTTRTVAGLRVKATLDAMNATASGTMRFARSKLTNLFRSGP